MARKKQRGCVISVVVPLENLQTHAAYLRLLTAVATWTMQRRPPARNRVLFLLDEFAALGRMDRIAGGLETLRKYKVWLWPVFQSLAQIEDLYRAKWRTFLANAGFRQFLAVHDPDTAEYVSKMCGTATVETETRDGKGVVVSRAATSRRLVTPDEVLSLPEGLQICFIGALRPVLCRKRPYWKRPRLRRRVYPNPFHARTPGPGWLWPMEWLIGLAAKWIGNLLAPHPYAAAMYAAAALLWLQPAVMISDADMPGKTRTCRYLAPASWPLVRTHHANGTQACRWLILNGNLW